jgi:putative ABC transport system permease protein
MRLLAGRDFTTADGDAAPRVAIVNETLARRLWPGEDPVGKRLKQGWPEGDSPWREVVGVAADVKMEGVDEDTPMQVYLPIEQETPRSVALVARTADGPLAHQAAVEGVLHEIVPDAPVYRVRSMDQVRGDAIGRQRLTTALLAGFGALALLLAAVGIYGVTSYSVTQRTHDIGVRMALGARPADVRRLVVGQGLVVTLVGLAVGLAAAFGLTRLMEGLLFDVSATDPTTFVVISSLLAAVAVVACIFPARRATKVDPVVALRHE